MSGEKADRGERVLPRAEFERKAKSLQLSIVEILDTDAALRAERDHLREALLEHACNCGPLDPDPAEHRESCPYRCVLVAA